MRLAGKGRLVESRAHIGRAIDLTADGILRTKWHACSTKYTFMGYTVQIVPGRARLYGIDQPSDHPL